MKKNNILFKNITYFNKYLLITLSILIVITSGITSYAFFTYEVTGTKIITLNTKEYPCYDWTETSTEVTITNYNCYEGNSYGFPVITNVTIPSKINNKNVVAIADYVGGTATTFYKKGITKVILPNTLKTIGAHSFRDNNLTGTLTIPSSVTSIGGWAFNSSTKNTYNQLTGLTFQSGSNLTLLDSHAFFQNNIGSLSTFNYLTKLQTIGDSVFENNNITGTLVIPASVTSIGGWAFNSSTKNTYNKLTGLTFQSGSNLTLLDSYAFFQNNISSLSTFNYLTKLQTIDIAAFQGNNISGTLVIPASVNTIKYGAFFKDTSSNPNLATIRNLTGKAFDWELIINNRNGTLRVTGIVTNSAGNVNVTS